MMEFLLDPNVAYVILVTGFVIAVLALASPGTGFMEVIALFLLFLAGYALFRLPIHYWALGMVLFSIIPFIISIRFFRRKWLLLLSMVILIVGTIFFFQGEGNKPAIQPVLAVVVSLSALTGMWIIGRRSIEAVLMRPVFDLDRLMGKIGEARADFQSEGPVYVMGEEWSARSNHPSQKGSRVRVIGREGLVLLVEEVGKDEK